MANARVVAGSCVAALAAILAAALLDPEHQVLEDYISWLSGGQYAWLAAIGLMLLAAATAQVAQHVGATLGSTRNGRGAATALWCSAALVVATVVVSSKGYDEPLWRQATHVGLGVGSMMALAVATLLFSRVASPRQAAGRAWARRFYVASAVLWIASLVGRAGGPDLRGAVQLVALACAMAWLVNAARVPSTRPGPSLRSPS